MEKNDFQIYKEIEYPRSGILSKVLVKSEGKDVTLFCMSKGSELSSHTSTKDGIVYVIEGKGTFVLKGKKIPMVEGVMIHMEKKAVHSLSAKENTAFLLILSK